jgi:hypothetical protein
MSEISEEEFVQALSEAVSLWRMQEVRGHFRSFVVFVQYSRSVFQYVESECSQCEVVLEVDLGVISIVLRLLRQFPS